jgi:prepilin-type N-terminal cleavage/methylation domain-containing protein
MDAADHRGFAGRGGFTLIELLVVVAIIAVLVGLVLGGASAVKTSSQNSSTQILLQKLKTVDIEYRAQSGYIVSFFGTEPNEGDSIKKFVAEVSGFSEVKKLLIAAGEKYVQSTDADPDPETVVDAWGTLVQYRAYMEDEAPAYSGIGVGDLPARGTKDEPQPYFASAGPDMKFGTEDDIYSFNLD